MLALRQAQKIPTIGDAEGPGVTDPSILQSVMPHQVADDEAGADAPAGAGAGDGVDANANQGAGAGGAGNAPKRHMLTHSPAGMLTGPMYLTWNLLSVQYQAWFCQQLGVEPPCLAPYAAPLLLWQIRNRRRSFEHLHAAQRQLVRGTRAPLNRGG